PNGAGRVLAAQVEPFAELPRAHRDDDVAARAVERDHDAPRCALPPSLDERELIEVEHRRYDIRVGVRAAFFDVGDTLVEGWDPDYRILARAALPASTANVAGTSRSSRPSTSRPPTTGRRARRRPRSWSAGCATSRCRY